MAALFRLSAAVFAAEQQDYKKYHSIIGERGVQPCVPPGTAGGARRRKILLAKIVSRQKLQCISCVCPSIVVLAVVVATPSPPSPATPGVNITQTQRFRKL